MTTDTELLARLTKEFPPAKMAQESLAFYMSFVHTDSDMPDVAAGALVPNWHHKVLIDALSTDELGNTLILMPRGSAKTVIIQCWVEWMIGRASLSGDKQWANRIRIIYVSATAAQAYRLSNAVRGIIDANPLYHQIFPKVKPHKDKWSESEWKVKGNTVKEANFLALGRAGPMLGARADYIISDDIVDLDVARSPAEQEATILWLDKVVTPVLVPGGRWVMPMTRWYEGDPADWAREQNWHEIYVQALNEKDESFWPERFSSESLIAWRKAKPLEFALSMQNEITPYGGLMFKREWFDSRFEYVPAPGDIHGIYASWDTAGTLTGRSYTVGAVIAVTKGWDYYLLQLVRGKMEYADVRKAIKDTATRFKTAATFIEDRSTGQSAVQELKKDPNFYGGIVAVPPFGQRGGPPSRSELLFIESVTPPFQDRRFLIPDSAYFERHNMEDWRDVFFTEMLGYPDASVDDIVVAITQLVYLFEKEKYYFEAQERMGRRTLGYGRPTERAVAI